jgi:hypothetical protein
MDTVMDSVKVTKSTESGTEVRMVRKLERSPDGTA